MAAHTSTVGGLVQNSDRIPGSGLVDVSTVRRYRETGSLPMGKPPVPTCQRGLFRFNS